MGWERAGMWAGALGVALWACAAEAQVSRVFVSVSGNDANVCSNVATPCRTLAAGIAQVDPQGEVIILTTGSYAGGTISKSVKINVPAGIVAFSALPITVNPGPGGQVVIRGMTLKSATQGSGNGIEHQSGKLHLENMIIDGWRNCVIAGSTEPLFVTGSTIRNCFSGVPDGNGLVVCMPCQARVVIDNSTFDTNYTGVRAYAGRVSVTRSLFQGNVYGVYTPEGGSFAPTIHVDTCDIRGIQGVTSEAGAIRLWLTSAPNAYQTGTGQIFSYGNNVIGIVNGTLTPVVTK